LPGKLFEKSFGTFDGVLFIIVKYIRRALFAIIRFRGSVPRFFEILRLDIFAALSRAFYGIWRLNIFSVFIFSPRAVSRLCTAFV
jgi:hypothetical protein